MSRRKYLREDDYEAVQQINDRAREIEYRRAMRIIGALLILLLLCVLSLPLWAAQAAESSGPRSALLSWTCVTTNTDGSAITGPVTYRVYRGSAGQPKTAVATTPACTLLLTGQPLGRQCYAITANTTAESAQSAEACKTMTLSPPTDGAIER